MKHENKVGWNLEQSYQQLPQIFYKNIHPTSVKKPELKVFNYELTKTMGLRSDYFQKSDGLAVLGGNKIPSGSCPLAQAYAGHQFGHFTRLGDGRAILLGEQIDPNGETFDIQLKGAGKTPFSRGGDGRATLGSMLREYIISEAMYALDIPTTRSLAVVTTGDPVIREIERKGAILTRIASSHIRVGTFQYAAEWGTGEELQALADYTIKRHDTEAAQSDDPYLTFLENVIDRQAHLIAKWQLVGFIHGVMNTDNMTISGETIDYGPCAFMDTYHRSTVFSSIDHDGRYAYGNQPYIGGWNLTRFAETLLPLLSEKEEQAVQIAQKALSTYEHLFQDYYLNGMRLKLGLFNKEKADKTLINDLLKLMEKYHMDYTNTFISLTFDLIDEKFLANQKDFLQWHERWINRRKRQKQIETESVQLMRKKNPAVIPRNHRVEEALEAAVEKNDYSKMTRLLQVLLNPFEHSSEQIEYAKVPESIEPYVTYCGT